MPSSTPTPTPEVKAPPAAESTERSLLNSAPSGAPEKYEAFSVPEGWEMDPEVGKQAEALFKEHNLPQSAAQALVDFYAKQSIQAQNAPVEFYSNMRQGWRETAMAHPELKGKLDPGGDVLTTINRGLDALGNRQLVSEFKEAMDFTGAGDHPAFIRVVYALAKRLSEGSHVRGNGPVPSTRPGGRTAAQRMYPDLPSVDS